MSEGSMADLDVSPRYLHASRRPNSASALTAELLLVLLTPLLLLIAAAVLLGSRGPMLVKAPHFRANGQMVHLTEFRVHPAFDPETHDRRAGRQGSGLQGPGLQGSGLTRVGAFLRATRLDRLPVLLDIRDGRVGFAEGFLG